MPKPVQRSEYWQPLTICHKSYITCQSKLMSSNHLQMEEKAYTIELLSGDSAVILQAYSIHVNSVYTGCFQTLSL